MQLRSLLVAMPLLAGLACSDVDRTRWSARMGSAESQHVMGSRYAAGNGVEADLDLALEWFEEAAAQGHAPSQHRLVALYDERGAEGDAERALDWLRVLAESGDAVGQYLYGHRLVAAGEGTAGGVWVEKAARAGHAPARVVLARNLAREEATRPEAIALFQKAARDGDPDAAYELSRLGAGAGASMGADELAALLREAADGGHAGAQFALGERLADRSREDHDDREALRWYRLAAEQGFAPAQEAVGILFELGRGVPADPLEAARWYRLAGEQGRAASQSQLARLYAKGLVPDEETAEQIALLERLAIGDEEEFARLTKLGREKGDRRAVEWYRRAIENDYAPAMVSLGKMIEAGRVPDAEAGEAVALFERAAGLGDPVAQSELAVRYSKGQGVDRDPAASLSMLRSAARGGHGPSQLALATLLFQGIDGEPDHAGAASWFRAAVESGVHEAEVTYAILLAKGIGVAQDDAAARALFEKAAERGEKDAEYSLGVFYEEGRGGLEPDPNRAVMWWKRAANQGQPQAQAKLGAALIRGEGTPRNVVEAYAWLAASGLEEAEVWVDAIEKEMPDAMRFQARLLAEKRKALREAADPGDAAVPDIVE